MFRECTANGASKVLDLSLFWKPSKFWFPISMTPLSLVFIHTHPSPSSRFNWSRSGFLLLGDLYVDAQAFELLNVRLTFPSRSPPNSFSSQGIWGPLSLLWWETSKQTWLWWFSWPDWKGDTWDHRDADVLTELGQGGGEGERRETFGRDRDEDGDQEGRGQGGGGGGGGQHRQFLLLQVDGQGKP